MMNKMVLTANLETVPKIIPFLYLARQISELLYKLKFELYDSGMAELFQFARLHQFT